MSRGRRGWGPAVGSLSRRAFLDLLRNLTSLCGVPRHSRSSRVGGHPVRAIENELFPPVPSRPNSPSQNTVHSATTLPSKPRRSKIQERYPSTHYTWSAETHLTTTQPPDSNMPGPQVNGAPKTNGMTTKKAAPSRAPVKRATPNGTRPAQKARPVQNKAASVAGGDSYANGVGGAYAIMASRIANRVAEMAESITFVERYVLFMTSSAGARALTIPPAKNPRCNNRCRTSLRAARGLLASLRCACLPAGAASPLPSPRLFSTTLFKRCCSCKIACSQPLPNFRNQRVAWTSPLSRSTQPNLPSSAESLR